jgi:hypothetical protein
MADLERSAFAWTLPGTAAAREALAAAVCADGTRKVYIKAGGDGGVVWIPGVQRPAFARPQWDDTWLQPFMDRGIELVPWYYNHPGDDSEYNAILTTLEHRKPSPRADGKLEILLNPEVEWARNNGFDNDYALRWVTYLRDNIRDLTGWELWIGYSSCPTWTWFPYEGFARSCDFAAPQHYWLRNLLPDFGPLDEDQVEAHIRRAGPTQPCVPILTASREYTSSVVVALAVEAVEDYVAARDAIDGLSSWECANGAYQHDAMAASYALLDGLGRIEPDANKLRVWFNTHRRGA